MGMIIMMTMIIGLLEFRLEFDPHAWNAHYNRLKICHFEAEFGPNAGRAWDVEEEEGVWSEGHFSRWIELAELARARVVYVSGEESTPRTKFSENSTPGAKSGEDSTPEAKSGEDSTPTWLTTKIYTPCLLYTSDAADE